MYYRVLVLGMDGVNSPDFTHAHIMQDGEMHVEMNYRYPFHSVMRTPPILPIDEDADSPGVMGPSSSRAEMIEASQRIDG